MSANHDHHRKPAGELLAALAADTHRNPELTAMAAVAEAVLTVADQLDELRELLTVKLPAQPAIPDKTIVYSAKSGGKPAILSDELQEPR